MRTVHPLWRGFWLAAAMTATLLMLGETDSLGPFRLDRKLLVYAGAMTAGAFLASVPARLRRKESCEKPSWQRCLRAFLSGAVMALALGMAGSESILSALMTGSAGAYAFCTAALAAGFVTVRVMEGRKSA